MSQPVKTIPYHGVLVAAFSILFSFAIVLGISQFFPDQPLVKSQAAMSTPLPTPAIVMLVDTATLKVAKENGFLLRVEGQKRNEVAIIEREHTSRGCSRTTTYALPGGWVGLSMLCRNGVTWP